MNKSNRFAVAVASALSGLLLGGSADAALVAYDGFSQYVTAPATTTGVNNNSLIGQAPALTGFAASSPWTLAEGTTGANTVVFPRASASGLTYPGLPNVGGSAEYYRASTGSYAKNLFRNASTSDTSTTQWASFLLNVPANTAAETSVGLSWSSGNRLAVAVNASGLTRFGFSNTSGTSLPTFSATYTPGSTHLYLLKVQSLTSPGLENQDQVTLWVDPDLSTLNPADESTLGAGLTGRGILRDDGAGQIGTFSELRFSVTPNANSTWLDEFRLGTTLYDAAPVPEPTALAAAGVAATLLLRRRHR